MIAHLNGVEGEKGGLASQLMRYIRGREVDCEPVEPQTAQYHCKVGNIDLGEAVVLNAAANASERLVGAEEKARAPAVVSGESSGLGAELLAALRAEGRQKRGLQDGRRPPPTEPPRSQVKSGSFYLGDRLELIRILAPVPFQPHFFYKVKEFAVVRV
jgi:hypothetical protein